jgi:hypothetical protein
MSVSVALDARFRGHDDIILEPVQLEPIMS